MIFEIDARGGVPTYRQIMDQARRQIVTGQMAEGEPLEQAPSLAARLKVNPMTISKAYGYLEREGVVERRRGVGLFVAPVEKDALIRKKKEMLEGKSSGPPLYAKRFGFRRRRVFNHGTPGEFAMLRRGETRIELVKALKKTDGEEPAEKAKKEAFEAVRKETRRDV
ncbi:MAG TPA: GntR family transcriptional regulator [Sumerlaeia bacterium]|nr:GntR family transcriptional regulator [Sumerlaeia bacterium]